MSLKITRAPMTNPAPAALIVGDDEHIREMMPEMLARAGYAVRSFGTGHDAMFGAQATPPDVYVLDVRLPDLNGRDLCRALKANEPTRRQVMMISVESGDFDIGQARTAGVTTSCPSRSGGPS